MTVEALRRGRPEVLAELLDRYGGDIQGVAWLILRDRDEAEDVVVETLLTALGKAHALREPGALRAWLLRIAVNEALRRRKRAARVRYLTILPERAAPSHEPAALERTVLLGVVDTLPPRMRAAVVLHYYADLSVESVAQALGTSQNTVKSQLRTALTRMRAALTDEHIGHPTEEFGHV